MYNYRVPGPYDMKVALNCYKIERFKKSAKIIPTTSMLIL